MLYFFILCKLNLNEGNEILFFVNDAAFLNNFLSELVQFLLHCKIA